MEPQIRISLVRATREREEVHVKALDAAPMLFVIKRLGRTREAANLFDDRALGVTSEVTIRRDDAPLERRRNPRLPIREPLVLRRRERIDRSATREQRRGNRERGDRLPPLVRLSSNLHGLSSGGQKLHSV